MRRDEVLAVLTAHRAQCAEFGVRSLALLGSMARDEAGPASDIDLLVEFNGPATFDRSMELKLRLEEVLGRRVDLVSARALRPQLRPAVEREAIRVA